jgi:hypothetical protein
MMYRDGKRSSLVISIVLAVVVLVAVILLVVNAVGSQKDGDNGAADAGTQALTTINGDSGVRMTVRGKIVAEEVHSSYQITVRPTGRVMNVYQGYLKTLVNSKVENNNFEAYTQFAYALNKVGLAKGKESAVDVRGICATGTLTTFEILEGERVVKSLWRTSCSKDTESFVGKYAAVEKLFTDQIVDYKDLLKSVKL